MALGGNLEKKKWIWAEPERFMKYVLGESLWAKQLEIVRSVELHKRTAVRTCHGIGKTRVASCIALTYLYRHANSIVITTAPTWRQVYQQLWREIRGRHHGARIELVGNKFLSPRYELGENWYAIGISTKEPEKFQGYHAPYILIIADEASGIDPKIFEAIHGIMASGSSRLLLLGNPTRTNGEFYDAFRSARNTYNTIHVSAFDTPNLAPHKEQFKKIESKSEKVAFLRSLKPTVPFLVNADFIADMLEAFGEDSHIYKVRVLGEFPDDDPDQLIKLSWIEDAQNRWEELEEKWWELDYFEGAVIGADIARYGDAETVLCCRLGNVVAPLVITSKQDTMQTAGAIVLKAREIRAARINIDVVGVGSGVYDRCRELEMPARAINVGEKAQDSDHFLNLRAEVYWNLKMKFERGEIAIPPDQKLAGQLSTLKYKVTSNGKMQIESKEDMRNKGISSPDRADALALAMIDTAESHGAAGYVEQQRQYGGMDVPERFQKAENYSFSTNPRYRNRGIWGQ